MSERRRIFVRRIGSSWSGYLPLWGVAITVWCVNSALLLGAAVSSQQLLASISANVVAAAVVLSLGIAWREVIRRRPAEHMPVWIVFAMGAFVGAAKGVTTYLVLWSMTGVPITASALAQNSLPAIAIGLWLLPAFGIIGSIHDDYNEERTRLISEIVTRELSDATHRYLDNDVTRFVNRAKAQLEEAGTSSAAFRETLTELAEHDLRPMSHKLWQNEDASIEGYGFKDLALSAMYQHRFPAEWTSVSLFISLLSLQMPLVGLTDALQRSAFQALIALVVLTLGRLIPFRGHVMGSVIFFLTPAAAVLAIEVLTLNFAGPLPGVTSWIADLSLYIALVVTLLVLGAVFSARDSHEEVRLRLSTLREQSIVADADRIIDQLRRRETAEFLHGYVQNQLLASAVELSNKPDSLENVRETIVRMLGDLESGELGSRSVTPLSLESVTTGLRETWRGIMDVSFDVSTPVVLSTSEISVVDRLCSEFASNARRHGQATRLFISLVSTNEFITLSAEDNGTGFVPGRTGLGTALLESLSSGKWSRTSFPDASGTQVTCQIKRLH